MHFIGTKIDLPANSSRLFKEIEDAVEQPTASVQLATSKDKNFIFNSSFDPLNILYDSNYCTVEAFHFKYSQEYFEELFPKLNQFTAIIEIGCGQGEFVKYLHTKGLTAYGFDPVLRETTDSLVDEIWSPSNERERIEQSKDFAPLYIMRCVLPHIPEPFEFLDGIFQNQPSGAVLLEFQRREWIEDEKVWSQISHDHVNIFSESDFSPRYNVISKAIFGNEEWVYVLLMRSTTAPTEAPKLSLSRYLKFENLFSIRDAEISLLVESNRPIAVYGGAGKGIVLSYSLKNAGVKDLIAIDFDINRHDLYMECSGVRIVSKEEFDTNFTRNYLIVVANPNHFTFACNNFKKYDVICIGRISESLELI